MTFENSNSGRMLPVSLMGLTESELTALASEGALIAEKQSMMAGYKTYFVAAVMAACAVAMMFGVAIPEEVWIMLNAIGLGTLRAAVESVK